MPVIARRRWPADLDRIAQVAGGEGAAKCLQLFAFAGIEPFFDQVHAHQQAGQFGLVDGTERRLVSAAPGQHQLARIVQIRSLARQPPGQRLQARLAPVFLCLLAFGAAILAIEQAAGAHMTHQMHGPIHCLLCCAQHLRRHLFWHLRRQCIGSRRRRQRKGQRSRSGGRCCPHASQRQSQQATQHGAPGNQKRVSLAARRKLSRIGVQSSSSTPPAE